jgi:hypothetical protein
MSSVGKILGALVQIAFTVVGAMFGGPVGAFIGATIGAFASAGIQSLLKDPSTPADRQTSTVKVAEPVRWLNAGRCKASGALVFAEFASDGDLWYIVLHGDSELISTHKIYLDDVAVTLGYDGSVLTKDFRLTSANEAVSYDGVGDPHIWLYTATYSPTNPVPPFPSAEFLSFFSQWTSEHVLAGTTYTVVHCLGMKTEDRYKWYKWRGALGLGEPSVAIVGNFSRCYDPRDSDQVLSDETTWKFTRNPALIWAWFRTHRYGRRKSLNSINWDRIAEQADICDEEVTGISDTHFRYRCDIAIPEDQDRGEAEAAILATMDGQLVFDDDGRYWCRAGYYYAPTVYLHRNRDIVAMESVEAVDGESETQGVIVRYTDPDAAYTLQPSAAWTNPNYYVAGSAASFLTVEIAAIQDHNQAMRIAKAIGMRQQPVYKLAPTTFLRGLKCVGERIMNLNYDNTFSGDHEICTQVELDGAGAMVKFGLVPVDADRWTLLSGEEKEKPVTDDSIADLSTVSVTGLALTYVSGQIVASFDVPASTSADFQFQYIRTSDDGTSEWLEMTVSTFYGYAISGPVSEGNEYSIRYRTRLAVYVEPWSTSITFSPGLSISAVTDLTAAGRTGEIEVSWRNPNSFAFSFARVLQADTPSIGAASGVGEVVGGLGQISTLTLSTTGTHYYWVIAVATDGSGSGAVGPVTATGT